MTEPTPTEPVTWAEDTSIAEAVRYASYDFPIFLLQMAAAERQKSTPAMLEAVQNMRHLVGRLEQYCRMKEKQWTAAASAILNQEKTSA